MDISLCIHGHFYQPPREDPWLGKIFPEPSAAPMRHWNERILRESYAPLAFARRLDGQGNIIELLNAYEWMSFNVGPTLLHWLRRTAPKIIRRMREGDKKSIDRLGYGNAIAQVYHHIIMPLASDRDKLLQVRWAIADFMYHFSRRPQGMWLAECAVDTATLAVLADEGIEFVILAPRQAQAIVDDGNIIPVNEATLDVGQGYFVSLPHGKTIQVVFYHGGLSQSIAFNGLLRDGEIFWQRIAETAHSLAPNKAGKAMLTLGTDGETYGHHFTFGEMALAYVFAQARNQRENISISNIPAFLAANPPAREVLLHVPSSWSCTHGVERWRSDCGCTDGGHPDWNQKWRGPLREALNYMRDQIDGHFETIGKNCFYNPKKALAALGEVLADKYKRPSFMVEHFLPDTHKDTAWKILAMQEQALSAFASCAWFFDDIGRLEPGNALTYALRAFDLMQETGGSDCLHNMLDILEKAVSNMPSIGTGRNFFTNEILPRRDDSAILCLIALLLLYVQGRLSEDIPVSMVSPRVTVDIVLDTESQTGHMFSGTATIRRDLESDGENLQWQWFIPSLRISHTGAFNVLANSEVTVTPTDSSGISRQLTARVGDLAAPMREYILSSSLWAMEQKERPYQRAIARHALSLFSPWREGQTNVHQPEYWSVITPYLLFEAMGEQNMSSGKLNQLAAFLTQHMTVPVKALAMHLVEQEFLSLLESGKVDDNLFALFVSRINILLPDMDWWGVQNTLWVFGINRLPKFAKSLGFR